MTNKIQLSIIVPVYNVAQFLPECLDSLLDQKEFYYEIVCIDDGSTDDSGSILESYKNRFPNRIVTKHLENCGPSNARNVGLEMARGKYVGFIDSDDVLACREVYFEMVELANKHQLDIVIGQINRLLNGQVEPMPKVPVLDTDVYDFNSINLLAIPSSACNKIYNREFLIKHNVWFSRELKSLEALPFYVCCFLNAKKISHVDLPIFNYRISDGVEHVSTTSRKNDDFVSSYFASYIEALTMLHQHNQYQYDKDIYNKLVSLIDRVVNKTNNTSKVYVEYRSRLLKIIPIRFFLKLSRKNRVLYSLIWLSPRFEMFSFLYDLVYISLKRCWHGVTYFFSVRR
ncbi:glycosyltransferase [Vibrio tritonius]|uniref:glycosyltransferase n=1 Tax=Vibrio tritonius TaxID=1435069 RepID=UPI00315C78C3